MKPFQDQTYYELLEIPTKASMDEIRAAYDRQSELYGADSVAIYALENPSLADELRSRLREAMEILTDDDLRQEYDRMIGIAPRQAPAEMLRRESEAREELEDDEDRVPTAAEVTDPAQLMMAEVMGTAEAVDSTHRDVKVSYAGATAPAPEPAPVPPPPAPRVQPNELDTRPPPPPARSPAREAAPVMASEDAIADAESAMAQVAAKLKETPRPKPLEIAPDADISGELLRRVREAKGLSLQQVADRTRIGSRHLENIEADRYSDLPATVYLRGMLTSLAREIGLDGPRVVKSYLALAKR